ncbi:zinc finger MYND domain-containing protein 11-like [Anopheles bellator]|uniref:zinc finger MYND domain-containing protein 11-like n=1 Tax=Anopheles bellator TaxID=139047 RepID=UPI0026480FFF|nr:zinc finger MYND domain-containing protein 11-like [Anopheles bellator]
MGSPHPKNTCPDFIKRVWTKLIGAPDEKLEHNRLVNQLKKQRSEEFSADYITEQLKYAVTENLLIESSSPRGRSKQKPPSAWYALPKWQDQQFFAEEQPDYWCYECHLATATSATYESMVKCESCMRSFHKNCAKTSHEKQLELEQFISKHQRITVSSFGGIETLKRTGRQSMASVTLTEENSNDSTMDESQSEDTSVLLEVTDEESSLLNERQLQDGTVKHECSGSELEDSTVKQEEQDTKHTMCEVDEPEFVCIVRLPNRRERLSTPHVKPEDDTNSAAASGTEEDLMHRYCYACRLQREAGSTANLTKRELNYLLDFMMQRYRTWLPDDTFSATKLMQPSSRSGMERKVIEICKRLLLRFPKSLDDILKAVATDRYTTLQEFQVDLQDVVHNVAIIHGVSSGEYIAVMYLLADCVYDMAEINQCPDCFRHSNERIEPDWFTRPCATRHELVYAKQKSFQYWPAKVVRVLNNKYDVRFFGEHTRALVPAACVKPIDTDPRTLKINPRKSGYEAAMRELTKHQALLDGPRERFSFGSSDQFGDNLETPNKATRHSLLKRHSENPTSSKPSKKQKMNNGTASDVTTPNKKAPVAVNVSPQHSVSTSNGVAVATINPTPRLPRTKQNLKMTQGDIDLNWVKSQLDQAHDLEKVKEVALQIVRDYNERHRSAIESLKNSHNNRIAEVKKKQWCCVCEKPASYYCCWNTSYCSRACQQSHWPAHKTHHKPAQHTK